MCRRKYREGLLYRVESAGGALDFAYTEKGQLREVNAGRRVSFAHSEEGRLVEVTQPNGGLSRYEYDEFGRMTRLKNPLGITSLENSYDAQGRTTEQRFADGGCAHVRYEEDTQTTEMIEQNGSKRARSKKTKIGFFERTYCMKSSGQV